MDAVICDNVSKTLYLPGRHRELLRNVTLNLAEGSFGCVLGSTGSGKSTLMSILAGVNAPDSGQVQVLGTNLASKTETQRSQFRAKNIGVVTSNNNLVESLTVEANLNLPQILTHELTDDARMAEVVALFGLEPVLHLHPSDIESKLHPIVAIARAMITGVQLLLCDEPAWSLSARETREVLQYLRIAQREYEITILLATSDPLAAAHAERTYLLSDGVVHGQIENPNLNSIIVAMEALNASTEGGELL